MGITIVLLGCCLWIAGCLFYFQYKSKTIHIEVKGNIPQGNSNVLVPNMNLAILFDDDKSLDHLVLSDMILNYNDLLDGVYKVPSIVSDVVEVILPKKEEIVNSTISESDINLAEKKDTFVKKDEDVLGDSKPINKDINISSKNYL